MPNSTYILSSENEVRGKKLSKNRVTILFCTNSAGTDKVTLIVIGKSSIQGV